MIILDKIKKIDSSKVIFAPLQEQVVKAQANYKNKDNLFTKEQENYTKIYNLVVTHFPEAAGIAPAAPPEPKMSREERMNFLKANKVVKG